LPMCWRRLFPLRIVGELNRLGNKVARFHVAF
jgi:hypothetical protein